MNEHVKHYLSRVAVGIGNIRYEADEVIKAIDSCESYDDILSISRRLERMVREMQIVSETFVAAENEFEEE